MPFTTTRSRPLTLEPSTEAQVYALFALAMALTVIGVFLGMVYAHVLIGSGIQIFFLFAELGLIFSARLWVERSPLNIVLFGLFPLLSGITVAPYILYVLAGYLNGGAILLNAFGATVFMAGASAVFALMTHVNLSGLGRVLLFGLLGLIFLGVAQIFFPALQTGGAEVMISGVGIILFALFLAYDIQRMRALSRFGANPFLLALSLYLDLFNLFLYVLRFMLALSGERR